MLQHLHRGKVQWRMTSIICLIIHKEVWLGVIASLLHGLHEQSGTILPS